MSISAELAQLIAMGFEENQAKHALLRTDNDVSAAVQYLSGDGFGEDDGEFDLIASAEPEPAIRPPTVFNTIDHQRSNDNITVADSALEVEDSRITSLVEMGFTAQQAEEALNLANGDVNEALTILLS